MSKTKGGERLDELSDQISPEMASKLLDISTSLREAVKEALGMIVALHERSPTPMHTYLTCMAVWQLMRTVGEGGGLQDQDRSVVAEIMENAIRSLYTKGVDNLTDAEKDFYNKLQDLASQQMQ